MDWSVVEQEVAQQAAALIRSKVGNDEKSFTSSSSINNDEKLKNNNNNNNNNTMYKDNASTSSEFKSTLQSSDIHQFMSSRIIEREMNSLQSTIREQDQRILALERSLASYSDASVNSSQSIRSNLEIVEKNTDIIQSHQNIQNDKISGFVEQMDDVVNRVLASENLVLNQNERIKQVTETSDSIVQLVQTSLNQLTDVKTNIEETKQMGFQSSAFAESFLQALLSLTSDTSSTSINNNDLNKEEIYMKGAFAAQAKEIKQLLFDGIDNIITNKIGDNGIVNTSKLDDDIEKMKRRYLDLHDNFQIHYRSYKLHESKLENVEEILGSYNMNEANNDNRFNLIEQEIRQLQVSTSSITKQMQSTVTSVSEKQDWLRRLQNQVDELQRALEGAGMELEHMQKELGKSGTVNNEIMTTNGINKNNMIDNSNNSNNLNKKVESLHTELKEFDERVTNALSQTVKVEGRFNDKINDSIDTVHERIKFLESKLDKINITTEEHHAVISSINVSETTTSSSSSTITTTTTATLESKMKELETNHNGIEGSLSGLREQVQVIGEQMNQLEVEFRKSLSDSIADKEKFATTSNMTLMNNRMKNLQSSLTAMQNELASVQDIQSDIQMMVKQSDSEIIEKKKSPNSRTPREVNVLGDNVRNVYSDKLEESSENVVVQQSIQDDIKAEDIEEKLIENDDNIKNIEDEDEVFSSDYDSLSDVEEIQSQSFEKDDSIKEGKGEENIWDKIESTSPSKIKSSPTPSPTAKITSTTNTATTNKTPPTESKPNRPATSVPSSYGGKVSTTAAASPLPVLSGSLLGRRSGNTTTATSSSSSSSSSSTTNSSVNKHLKLGPSPAAAVASSPAPDSRGRRAGSVISYNTTTSSAINTPSSATTMNDSTNINTTDTLKTTETSAVVSPSRIMASGRSDTLQCNFCLRRMPRAQIPEHHQTCSLRMDLCSKGCGMKVRFIKMEKHLKEDCPLRDDIIKPPPPP